MVMQRTLLASLIAASLAACGGDSGTTSGGGITNPEPTLNTLSGKAADGYLQEALVCLDINKNKMCDDNEPSATTDANGAFTLEATQAQIDASPLLVQVIAGQTTDSDNPGVAISKGYKLTAPAASDFVSPITTLIQNEIEKGSTVEESVEYVKTQLGTELDITADYIEGKNTDAEKAEFEKLHKVAQVTARVIATKFDELKDQATNNGVSESDLINVINEEVSKVVSEIVSDVNGVTGDFDPDEVASTAKDKVDLSDNDLEDKVNANNADRNKVTASLNTLITETGLLWFGGSKNGDGIPSLEYGKIFADNDGTVVEEEYQARSDLSGFDVVEKQPNILLMLTAKGWVSADDTIVGVETAENGTETLVMKSAELSFTAKTQKVDVSGLRIADIMDKTADANIWSSVLDNSATFPEGTFAYKLKTTPLVSDYFTLYPGDWCDDAYESDRGGMCNSVALENGVSQGVPAETLAQIIKESADGLVAGSVTVGGTNEGGLIAEIVADGTVKFFAWDWVNPVSDPIGSGTWKELTEHGKTIIEVSAPSDVAQQSTWSLFDSVTGKAYLTEVDGFVRLVAPAEAHAEEEYVFEASTLPVILDSFNYPLTLGECLASLPDVEYVQKSGDTIEYSATKFDGVETLELVESFEYLGNTFTWLTGSDYSNITDFPQWVEQTDGTLQKMLFSQRDLEGNVLAKEESYFSNSVYFGEEGFDAEGNYGWWGSVRATLPDAIDRDNKELNTPVQYAFEKVSMNDLKLLEFDGGSFASLPKTSITVLETYKGKQEVTVPAGTFQACKVVELASYEIYGTVVSDVDVSWYTNKGRVKQQINASWAQQYNRYATALPK